MSTLKLALEFDPEFDSVIDFLEQVQHEAAQLIEPSLEEISADDLGIDPRVGPLYVTKDKDAIVKRGSTRMLEYYGGFEYIDSEDKVEVGNFTFYLESSNRVREHLDTLLGVDLEEDGEDDE